MGIAGGCVVGVSLGGAVGQRLGVMLRGGVRSLVLLGTAASLPPPDFWLYRAAAVRNAGIEQFIESSVARWVAVASLGPPAAEALRSMLVRAEPDGDAASP